jgi:parallel beta-helix repeat protein
MNKKLIFSILLMLFLSRISSATLEVHSVEASETIYIRTDGSIDPPTAELSSNDNITYSMTGNLSSSIVIEKDNIVFDGADYTIQGSGSGNGIEMAGRNNVTIENVEVRGFYQGIMIYNSSRDNNVFGVRTIYNSHGGIWVDSSTNNNVTGNIVVSGDEGIALGGSGENNSVVRNDIHGTEFYGVSLMSASNNLIKNNNVSDCGSRGIVLSFLSCNNVVAENNVTECKTGIEVSYSSNNNTVSNNCFSMNQAVGIDIGFRIPESGPDWGGAADNHIIENNVTRNNLGIELIYSKNNTIFHNNFEINNSSVAIIGSYFNIWDDGAIGNYWSDYNGTDANHDNIGDTPYVIDANNSDRYPLMAPYIIPEFIIPEFPSFLTILLFAMATILVVIFYRRKHV